MGVILCVPDLHTPYQHPMAWSFLSALKKKYRPDTIVILGDEVDCHRFSKHTQVVEAPGPADEIAQAREALKPLFRMFSVAKVCTSNHTLRLQKRAAEAGLPRDFLKHVRDFLGAPPGWRWQDFWNVGNIRFLHGDGFGGKTPALTAAERLRQNVVLGHVHSAAGVWYSAAPKSVLWGMSCGALINSDALAFHYARYSPKRPVLGAGLIIDGIPHFIPMRG